jgi:HSP20 family protein
MNENEKEKYMNFKNHRDLTLQDNLVDVFELFRSGFPGMIQQEKGGFLKVDVVESPESYLIYADVPDQSKDSIKVNFDKGILSIEVQARANKEIREGEKLIRQERSYSRKSRSFNLGDRIDESAIKASHKDGVLTLELPKKSSATVVREINVE